MKNLAVPVDRDFNTTLKIGTPAFPLQVFYDDLQNYSNGFVNWHKQKQIEISLVQKGCVRLHELGREYLAEEGDCFVVLPGFLHAVKPEEGRTAQYVTFIFEPQLLFGYEGSYFEHAYFTPLRSKRAAVCLIKKESPLAGAALTSMHRLISDCAAGTAKEQLAVQRKLQDLWVLLFDHFLSPSVGCGRQGQEARICRMILDLHENYQTKFSLTAMAKRHNVSRGECCRYFKKMMGMTILDYLLEYRISKSLGLLEATGMTVTEIAQTVGIGSTSYYISAFKEKMSVTPARYRANSKKPTEGLCQSGQQPAQSTALQG